MDSSFAAYWATTHPHLTACCAVFFNYGQKGAGFEWQAAKKIADALSLQALYYDISAIRPMLGGGILRSGSAPVTDPKARDKNGMPATFVPGRNLILLSLLSDLVYSTNAQAIVGGWSSVDVEYPDCSAEFLTAASCALTLALGRMEQVTIHAPAVQITKAEVVRRGDALGINWALTRSCYSDRYQPCGQCDSCLVRARAFHANGMVDPVYTSKGAWQTVVHRLETEGYLDGQP
jgi:7-cyano-7-deazaguanine synthase